MDNCTNPIAIYQNIKHYSSPIKVRTGKYRNGPYKVQRAFKLEKTKFVVPCGKCPLCIQSHRMNWLMRVNQESATSPYPFHWFLTLTYNEKKVPRKRGVRTLYKRHPQLFLKRLRKAGFKIKYILVGEYGSETDRPHYHALCWTNAPDGAITHAWGYGHVHFRPMEHETILYTLKYALNPRKGDNESKAREYIVYSKGIGESYLTREMYEYHTGDYKNPIYTTVIDGTQVPLPRYYRKKIFTKQQNFQHAEMMYYKSLKDKWANIKRLKRLGVRNPVKFHGTLKHNRAALIKKRSNSKGKL